MSDCTVIVPDTALLQRVCGTNDSHLKLIEAFLGVPVFACGNELSVEAGRPEVAEQFRFIVDRILDEIADGGPELADTDIVRSVLSADGRGEYLVHGSGHGLFSGCSVVVPGGLRRVYPRTKGQADLVRLLRSADVVFATGPAGTGKTFIAVAEALRLVLSHQKGTLVLTRPVVESGESLGFLPGDLEEKINPYVRPLYDAMHALLPRETVRRMAEAGVVEVAPLAYMRGRTLADSVVILDEAQNTTVEQMKMFLTRMGEGSKVFITGDASQTDLPRKVPSGLLHAMRVLRGVDGIAMQELTVQDMVRNGLVRKIIQAYDDEREA